MVDLCPRPFRGVTICATGAMDKVRLFCLQLIQAVVKLTTCVKPTLFKQAFELGATSTSDFTDRVTHLLANSHGGAKYLVRLTPRCLSPLFNPIHLCTVRTRTQNTYHEPRMDNERIRGLVTR